MKTQIIQLHMTKILNFRLFNLKKFFNNLSKISLKIIDFLFPAQCSFCKEYWAFFCKKCIKKLNKRKNNEISSIFLEKIYAIYWYNSNKNLQKIIKNIKYKNLFSQIPEITDDLSKILFEKFWNKKIILVPVPLHFLRKIKRGFNQSEKIIYSILKNYSLIIKKRHNKIIHLNKWFSGLLHFAPLHSQWQWIWQNKNLLKRIKNTPHQASLDKKWRLLNLKNAFKINNFEKINSEIPLILVDDICTTWETLENCAIELKKYYKNPIFWLVISSDKK